MFSCEVVERGKRVMSVVRGERDENGGACTAHRHRGLILALCAADAKDDPAEVTLALRRARILRRRAQREAPPWGGGAGTERRERTALSMRLPRVQEQKIMALQCTVEDTVRTRAESRDM